MKVEVISSSVKPTDLAVASARSCYVGKEIIRVDDVKEWAKKDELLNSIFKAGHHTTLMHYNFTFLISGISRLLIWRLLHAHPFYNSEQVSQRYAKMKIENFYYPSDNKEEWEIFYSKMFNYYEKVIEILTPRIESILPKFKKREAVKRAQEFARYLLPMGMTAHMYHTVNVITALRYINGIKAIPEAKKEAQEFASLVEQEMLKIDNSLKPLIEFAKKEDVVFPDIDIESVKKRHSIKDEVVKVFDVVDYDFNLTANYAGVLRGSNLFLDEAILGSFNTYIKLSLSADAQNQRHRRSLAIRPKLEDIYKRDFYVPNILNDVKEYFEAHEYAYEFFEEQKEKIGFSEASYALLNSHNVEIIEHDDFQEFMHKSQMRLCYNAQEEIFNITYEQVKQLKALKVKAADKFLPPCGVRYIEKIKPYCPEGERFCGVKVWKLNFDEYEREI